MKAYYSEITCLMGSNGTHIWTRWLIAHQPRRWHVCGLGAFTRSGFAVVDDFGTLVEVPQ